MKPKCYNLEHIYIYEIWWYRHKVINAGNIKINSKALELMKRQANNHQKTPTETNVHLPSSPNECSLQLHQILGPVPVGVGSKQVNQMVTGWISQLYIGVQQWASQANC